MFFFSFYAICVFKSGCSSSFDIIQCFKVCFVYVVLKFLSFELCQSFDSVCNSQCEQVSRQFTDHCETDETAQYLIIIFISHTVKNLT